MAENHIVSAFDDELKDITGRVAEIGGIAEELIDLSMTALTRVDPEIAQTVITRDRKIDALQRELEEKAILMIARRQPMARDLRVIIAAIRISNDR